MFYSIRSKLKTIRNRCLTGVWPGFVINEDPVKVGMTFPPCSVIKDRLVKIFPNDRNRMLARETGSGMYDQTKSLPAGHVNVQIETRESESYNG